jgi:hypothetical protein
MPENPYQSPKEANERPEEPRNASRGERIMRPVGRYAVRVVYVILAIVAIEIVLWLSGNDLTGR